MLYYFYILNEFTFWDCLTDSVGIQNSNNKIDIEAKFSIIFDTGTNAIIFPLFIFKEIETNIIDFGCNLIYINKKSYSQLECQYNKRVDIRIRINDNILIIPKDIIFYEGNDRLYYSKVVFSDKNDYYIMGTPFFLAYHTLFDKENKQLHFYQLNNNYKKDVIPEEEDDDDYDDDNSDKDSLNTFSIICIVLVSIIFLIFFGYITYKIILLKNSKKELEEVLPSSNYLEYNVNFDE